MLYGSFIEPFLKEKEAKIDFAIANSGRIVKEHSTKVISTVTEKAGTLSSEVSRRRARRCVARRSRAYRRPAQLTCAHT
jgi:hypothetical protein